MREAFGGISLFQIAIIFLLLFAGIVAFSINHSKAFGVKDEMLHIIESGKPSVKAIKSNPLSPTTAKEVATYLQEAGYSTTGNCNSFGDGWVGYNAKGDKDDRKSTFCVKGTNVGDNFALQVVTKCTEDDCFQLQGKDAELTREVNEDTYPPMIYYEIGLFYKLDIPIINNILNFRMRGTTKLIQGDVS